MAAPSFVGASDDAVSGNLEACLLDSSKPPAQSFRLSP